MDFGIAMKSLSKEQLREIIGKDENKYHRVAARADGRRAKWFKPWMWQVGSIAAVIVIAFTIILNMHKQSRNALYDSIYASAQFAESHSRGGSPSVNITKLSDSELKVKLPEMEQDYRESENNDDLYETGYPLAMAYIRLHQPKPAFEILNNLVDKLQNDEYYEAEIKEIQLIINLIK